MWNQCDQIGRFLKALGDKFSCKSSQKIGDRLGHIYQYFTFKSKLLWLLFGQLLETLWLLFIPTSGHTVSGSK